MPRTKQKQLLKENGKQKSKRKNAPPETADEFLETGVDFEEAGEKWRAGDAIKSTRFFLKALENYDTGLEKFPEEFDLAYNKARVQFSLTQYPKLAAQLPHSLVELLEIALESHQYALKLQQRNADVLFNTAQVYVTLAEVNLEIPNSTPESHSIALRSLEQAIELFQRCLSLQELQYSEWQVQVETARRAAENSDTERHSQPQSAETITASNNSNSEQGTQQEEQWATILEPTTKATLLDTAMAQLDALTTFCGLVLQQDSPGLPWLHEYSNSLIQRMTAYSAELPDRLPEINLSKATFISAFSDSSFRGEALSLPDYKREIDSAWLGMELAGNAEGLCKRAEAHLAFSAAAKESLPQAASDQKIVSELLATVWKYLSSALADFTAATKLPDIQNASKIHLVKGDIELQRWSLGGSGYGPATSNAPQLLKNAATYYRGAAGVARSQGGLEDEEREGVVKEALAAALAGSGEGLMDMVQDPAQTVAVTRILEEVVEDDLLDQDVMENLGL